jgi:hypothetical protein
VQPLQIVRFRQEHDDTCKMSKQALHAATLARVCAAQLCPAGMWMCLSPQPTLLYPPRTREPAEPMHQSGQQHVIQHSSCCFMQGGWHPCMPTARTASLLLPAAAAFTCASALARPLSKTVRFNVLRVIPAGSGGDKKGFSGF